MTFNTATQEGRDKRLEEFVGEAKKTRNFRTLTRLIGGSPRHDVQDYSDADAGEAPKGAQW